MSLANYVHAAREQYLELVASLEDAEVDALRLICKDKGSDGWCDWYCDHIKEIQRYVSSTPSERKKKKSWNKGDSRLLLTLGACRHVYQAYALLSILDEGTIAPGGPYRLMTALAGKTFLDLLGQDIPDWYFSLPNPFEG